MFLRSSRTIYQWTDTLQSAGIGENCFIHSCCIVLSCIVIFCSLSKYPHYAGEQISSDNAFIRFIFARQRCKLHIHITAPLGLKINIHQLRYLYSSTSFSTSLKTLSSTGFWEPDDSFDSMLDREAALPTDLLAQVSSSSSCVIWISWTTVSFSFRRILLFTKLTNRLELFLT